MNGRTARVGLPVKAAATFLLVAVVSSPLRAQIPSGVLPQVRYEQKLGSQVPLDLSFTESSGKVVESDSLFQGRPVLLSLVRYRCDRLCPELLNGTVRALQPLSLLPGRDYDWVVVSLDSGEGPDLAGLKKLEYMRRYAHSGAAEGWHFLAGVDRDIDRITEAVGCRYYFDPRTKNWAEPEALIVLTPDGRISAYFLGTEFDSETLRQRLSLAASGDIGPADPGPQARCYPYDPTQTAPGRAALRVVRIAAGVSVLLLGVLVGGLLQRERRRPRSAAG